MALAADTDRTPRDGSLWARHQTTAPARLVDVEPDLFAALDARELRLAHQRVLVRVALAAPGPWEPPAEPRGASSCAGLLILAGFVSRDVSLARMGACELLGPGDVLRPWEHDTAPAALLARCRWEVLDPLRIAVLDEHFARTVAAWPSVLIALSERTFRRSRGLTFRLALTRVPRVETRLLLMLWHLAERWGRVGSDGVVLPLRLTHALLGELIGAHRPTVTLAVKALTAEGCLARLPRKGWLLKGAPPEIPLGQPVRMRTA